MTGRSASIRSLNGKAFVHTLVLFLILLPAVPLIRQNIDYLTSTLTAVVEGREHGGDFIAFYAAGRLYREQRDAGAYDLDRLREAEFEVDPQLRSNPEWTGGGVNPFRNPPFFLPLVAFFAGFPLPVAYVLAALGNAALLGSLLTVTGVVASRRAAPFAAVAWIGLCLAYYDVWHALIYGQMPAYVVALAVAVGAYLLRSGRPFWAGLVFSILLLKMQYLPALGLFLLAGRQWRGILGLVLGSLGLTVYSVALVGVSGLVRYVETVLHLAVAARGWYAANYESMINWRGLLERALAPEYTDLILPLQVTFTVVTLAVAFWAWLAPQNGNEWRRDLRLALLAVAMILSSPHVHVQDMVLLLPGFALVIGHLWQERAGVAPIIASSAGLLGLFWLLPLQELLSPRFHLSAFVIVILFCLIVLMLRARVPIPRLLGNRIEALNGFVRSDRPTKQ